MTTWQWVVVALVCMIAGMVVSRYMKPDAKKPDSNRKKDG